MDRREDKSTGTRNGTVKGLFIVLEGLDASGKTTQIAELAASLGSLGVAVVCEREPTDGETGKKIRAALVTGNPVTDDTLCEWFAEDRVWHIENRLMPQLLAGKVVICDRYVFSNFAYQSLSVGFERIAGLNRSSTDRLMPELTFFIDVPPEECCRRIELRNGVEERFDSLEKLKLIREGYINSFEYYNQAYDAKVVMIDGVRPIGEVTEAMLKHILPLVSKESMRAAEL